MFYSIFFIFSSSGRGMVLLNVFLAHCIIFDAKSWCCLTILCIDLVPFNLMRKLFFLFLYLTFPLIYHLIYIYIFIHVLLLLYSCLQLFLKATF